ncbi:peptide ABC transporter substrate-binding protein [Niveispirillum sp. SYP-B3756]|uniref:peptide ABC transporter substrate-binding protein n=1 Tax=Niveispirillum sp. SYP-B3756 TaxID=2662178 RepID=UPI001FFFD955|nr:peptide ABC transporter substrate-binding protein [Niveispirillum sp. SYP-B3756]
MIGRWLCLVVALFWLGSPAWAGGVLHRGNGSEPQSLDPHKSTGESDGWIQRDLLEPLLTVDARGALIPGAAEHWTISDDLRTYRFHLRPEGRWSDGSRVTADDFVFAWRRLLDPATASPYAFYLWPVKNGRAVAEGRLPPEALAVRAVDSLTFEVELAAPTGYFLAALQYPATAPLSRANVARYGDGFTQPGRLLSNGAFTLAAAVPQDHVKLVRNPRFHDAATVSLDAVYFYPTENQETELKRFRAGELDVTYDVPSAQLGWIRENLPGALRTAPFLSTYFYYFNLRREPWKSSPELRLALSLAIDRQVIVEKITRAGEAPAYTLTPPGTDNYQPPAPAWAGWSQAKREELARSLIRKAGYGPGGKPLEVEILFNNNELHRRIAIAMEAMWRQVLGVRGRLVNQEWRVLLANRAQGQFSDLARGGWIGDYNDAFSFLSILQSGAAGQNHAAYANADYDRLLIEAAAQGDPMRRRALMEQAETQLLADAPIIPLYTYVTSHLVAAHVRGWEDNIRDLHLSRYLSVVPKG